MTDTVYLHRHGPDLARAATLVESHLRFLMGDRQPSEPHASPAPLTGSPLVPAPIEPIDVEKEEATA